MSCARPGGSVAARSSSFRFHANAVERRRNGRFPLPSDLLTPPSAYAPEVCPELPAVLEPRGPVVLIKREALDDVRNGPAQQSEVDLRWRCEPDGLHGCRHVLTVRLRPPIDFPRRFHDGPSRNGHCPSKQDCQQLGGTLFHAAAHRDPPTTESVNPATLTARPWSRRGA